MVFTKLSAQEKDAFFALLDEYFQSRPELFGHDQGMSTSGLGGTGISTAAATSVVQRALAANTASSGGGTSGKSNNPYTAALHHATSNNAGTVPKIDPEAVGRVAAASRAFAQAAAGASGGGGGGVSSSSSSSPAPALGPSLPRRTIPAQIPGAEVDKLVSRKASVMNAFKKPPTAGVAIPSAFTASKSSFGPPPVRRGTSETSAGTGAGVGVARVTPPQTTAPPEEEVVEGEWVEVLYDYSSEEPTDLAIEAGMRVWVTAKSSEDWWTGQIDGQGKEGLFPASYVKPL